MTDTLIARQSIVDKNQKIFGYEIFSRNNNGSTEENTIENDSKQLFNILSTFGMDTLLDGNQGFLNCILEDNPLEYFNLISPKNVVLEIQKLKTETDENIKKILEKIEILKLKGYKIATSEIVLSKKYESWLEHIDYIKIDSLKYNESLMAAIITKGKNLKKTIIVEKIETMEKFNFYSKLNVDYFQGYFFCKPITLSAKISNPSALTIIKLINLTMQQAEIKEIEEHLKTDPTLSFKLLKYMNSYGVSGGVKIDSFNKAIMILGYKNLLKWLSILFTTTNKNQNADLLTKTALIRAKFMENLIDKSESSNQLTKDNAFIVGLFSLMDAMLNVSIESILESVTVPDEVKDAVLNKKGILNDVLNMAKALEINDWIEVFAYAYKFNLKEDVINEAYFDSLKWVKGLNI